MKFVIACLSLCSGLAFAAHENTPCDQIRGTWKVKRVDREGGCQVVLSVRGEDWGTPEGHWACRGAKPGDLWVATCGKDDPSPDVRQTLKSLGVLETAVKFEPVVKK